jgi:CxxC motif-containing protein (DUF1111 family)
MCAWHDIRGLVLSAMLLAATAIPAAAGPDDVIRDPSLPKDMKGLDFEIGRALFEQHWSAAPASTQATDGLGPLFNARACVICHTGGGRGTAYDAAGNVLPALLFKLGTPSAVGDPVYGQQIQPESVAGLGGEAHPSVTMETHTVTLRDGTTVTLRKPMPHLDGLAYGPLAAETTISLRLAPAMNGIGLLERIPEPEILARAGANDDGISGRPNAVIDPATGKTVLGRFGWKASEPSLEVQDAKALDLDIGLSNPIYRDPYGDCTKSEPRCRAMPNGASPQFENLEVPSPLTRLIDRFVSEAMLPVPATGSKDVAKPAIAQASTFQPPARCRPGGSRPIPICCCTTWATASPTRSRTGMPRAMNGGRRRSGVSALRCGPTMSACCMTAGRAACWRRSSGMTARRRRRGRRSRRSPPRIARH